MVARRKPKPVKKPCYPLVARRKPITAQRSPATELKPEKKPTNPVVARRKSITAQRSPAGEPKPEKKSSNPMMERRKPITAQRPPARQPKPEEKPSNAERSAYFARREAAKVLRSALQGDDRRQAVGSIKTLVYSPSKKQHLDDKHRSLLGS